MIISDGNEAKTNFSRIIGIFFSIIGILMVTFVIHFSPIILLWIKIVIYIEIAISCFFGAILLTIKFNKQDQKISSKFIQTINKKLPLKFIVGVTIVTTIFLFIFTVADNIH